MMIGLRNQTAIPLVQSKKVLEQSLWVVKRATDGVTSKKMD